jgi:hypothetical protein
VTVASAVGPQRLSSDQASRTWKKVKYLGGAVGVIGKSDTWDNSISISSNAIKLDLKKAEPIEIDPGRVTALSYGGVRHGAVRVKDYVVAGVAGGLVAPVVGAALLIETVQKRGIKHYIIIEYTTSDGRASAVLLQAHKDNYKAILEALRRATGIQEESSQKGGSNPFTAHGGHRLSHASSVSQTAGQAFNQKHGLVVAKRPEAPHDGADDGLKESARQTHHPLSGQNRAGRAPAGGENDDLTPQVQRDDLANLEETVLSGPIPEPGAPPNARAARRRSPHGPRRGGETRRARRS